MSWVWVLRRWRASAMICGIEADLLRDVDAGGGSGNADAQLVGGGESFLVEADGGVEDTGRVGGVDLERGVVGGDDGEGTGAAEVFGNGHGKGGSLFGIGGRAELVEQDERARGGGVGDEIDVGDVGGKGGEILLDGLRVADVGEDGVTDGQVGALGRDGDSGLGHENEQAHGFEADGFAAGVGAADDELTVSGSISRVRGTTDLPRERRLRSMTGWRASRQDEGVGTVLGPGV